MINILRYIPPTQSINALTLAEPSHKEPNKKQYLNTRTVFHSNALREIFARGGIAEVLDRYKKVVLFRVKCLDSGDEEFYELDIRRVYEKVEEVTPNWLI